MIVVPPSLSRLYLLRHAEAGWPENGQTDFDRPLNDVGYAQAEQVTNRAAGKDYTPDLIICSTALRCRQTAEAVRRNMRQEVSVFHFVDSLYDGSLRAYMDILAAAENVGSLMLIGHNPTISETLQTLIGPVPTGQIIPYGYPTAGLAVLEKLDNQGLAQPNWKAIDFLEA